jgi:multiple sugar transport system substrate-binding protein
MNRILALIGVLLIICVGFVFAGGQRAASGPEEVVFWTSHGPPENEILQGIVDAYNRTNPAVRVRFVQVPGSETDTAALMTAVRGGTGPDVYMLDRFIVAQRAADGVLTDITDVLTRIDPNISNKFMPFAWEEAQFRGRTFALPFDTDTRGLFYNIDMLRQAGIDPAIMDRSRGPITFDQLRDISRRIDTKDARGEYTRIGFIPQHNQGWHYTWGFNFDGEFAAPDMRTVTPTNDGVIAGFRFLYEWNYQMGFGKVQAFLSKYSPRPDDYYSNHPFIKEALAMTIHGDWFIDVLQKYNDDLEYGVTFIPVPQAGDRPSTWTGGYAFAIPDGVRSNRITEAMKFIAFACGPIGQRHYCAAFDKAPTVDFLARDASAERFYAPNQPYFQEALTSFARNRPPLPVGVSYWRALSEAQDKVVTSDLGPPNAAASRIREILEEVENKINQELSLIF